MTRLVNQYDPEVRKSFLKRYHPRRGQGPAFILKIYEEPETYARRFGHLPL